MAVGEKYVPGWVGTVPAFGVGWVGENGATENDGLRRIGQAVHGQAVQTVGGWEGRILSAIEDVGIADPLKQVVGGFVHGAALVHRAGHGAFGQTVMVQRPVGAVEDVGLRGADLVVVGPAGPDEPFHAPGPDIG